MKINYSKTIKILYYTSILSTLFIVSGVYINKITVTADNPQAGPIFADSSIAAFISDFYPWAVTISASLAVVMLIYAGYLYITSSGNVEQINNAKDHIIGAISGLVFLVLSFLIFNSLAV